MTYNTRDFLDDRWAAARVVRACSPDVRLLQEVPRRMLPGPRVARWAAQTGLSWPGAHAGAGGTTVMVSERVTVLGCRHRGLAVPVGQRTRGVTVADVRVGAVTRLTAVSVHLGLHEGQRLRHLAEILRALPDEGAVVLAGDLNEGPDGACRRLLEGRLRLLSADEPTFPVAVPTEPLDTVWGRGLRVTGRPPLPGAVAVDVRRASDHRPVCVDVLPA